MKLKHLKNQKGVAQPVLLVIVSVASLLVGFLVGKFLVGGGRDNNPVVAKLNGSSIRASEVFGPQTKLRLYELEEEMYNTKDQAINDFAERRLLEAESKKQNLSIEQLLEKETTGQAAEVSDKEVGEFLTSKGLSMDDPRFKKEQVRDYLKYKARFDKRMAYVTKLKQASDLKKLIEEPEPQKIKVDTAGYPSWGKENAPVTMVIFSDFQCPFCSRAVPTIDQIKKEYGPDKVRIVFRDMPLENHPKAKPAALASHCANDQGKFWEYHDALFKNQAKLDDADLKKYAKDLGLDVAKFDKCFDSKQFMNVVEKSVAEVNDPKTGPGIGATPSFVINGALLQGAQPYEQFKKRIDRELKNS